MKRRSFRSFGGVLVLLATVTLLVEGCLIISVPHQAGRPPPVTASGSTSTTKGS